MHQWVQLKRDFKTIYSGLNINEPFRYSLNMEKNPESEQGTKYMSKYLLKL